MRSGEPRAGVLAALAAALLTLLTLLGGAGPSPLAAQSTTPEAAAAAQGALDAADAALRRALALASDDDHAEAMRREPALRQQLDNARRYLGYARSGLETANARPSVAAYQDVTVLAQRATQGLDGYREQLSAIYRQLEVERRPPPPPPPSDEPPAVDADPPPTSPRDTSAETAADARRGSAEPEPSAADPGVVGPVGEEPAGRAEEPRAPSAEPAAPSSSSSEAPVSAASGSEASGSEASASEASASEAPFSEAPPSEAPRSETPASGPVPPRDASRATAPPPYAPPRAEAPRRDPSSRASKAPPALRAAVEQFLDGDYRAVVDGLDPEALRGKGRRAQALTLRAAARYGLFLLGGESDYQLRGEAPADIIAARRLAPDLEPAAGVFSPRFRDFYASTR